MKPTSGVLWIKTAKCCRRSPHGERGLKRRQTIVITPPLPGMARLIRLREMRGLVMVSYLCLHRLRSLLRAR